MTSCGALTAAAVLVHRTRARPTYSFLSSHLLFVRGDMWPSERERARCEQRLCAAHCCNASCALRRKRAEGLLRRQQYLEDLMRENGLAPPGGQEAASLQPAEAEQAPTEDKPYYMSSPSWY